MKLHRFYIDPDNQELKHSLWLRDQQLYQQWSRVLRFKPGDELVLFDGQLNDRLYRIVEFGRDAVKLDMITELKPQVPERKVYLFWALLKKDKNDWVIQKGTELGVTNFIPLVASRSEKTGFNIDRAIKISIEAAEQCGRSDLPHIRDSLSLGEALAEYRNKITLLVCDNNQPDATKINEKLQAADTQVGILIGPEGGWTDDECKLFSANKLANLHLGQLTLRAETAAVVAAARLVQAA